jgi:hypothetical protein
MILLTLSIGVFIAFLLNKYWDRLTLTISPRDKAFYIVIISLIAMVLFYFTWQFFLFLLVIAGILTFLYKKNTSDKTL